MTRPALTVRTSALAAILLGGSAFAVIAAPAQAQCDDNQGGAIAGALIGGLLGGAIGNEIRDDDDRQPRYEYRRGRRADYRGYGYERAGDDDDTAVVAGVLLGALAGGAIGASAGDCDNDRHGPRVIGPEYGYDDDPWRRGQVTRSGDYGWGYQSVPAPVPPPQPRPVYTPAPQPVPQPVYRPAPPPAAPAQAQDQCQTVYSETRFPDGRTVREPIRVCYDRQTDRWYRAGSEELYGY